LAQPKNKTILLPHSQTHTQTHTQHLHIGLSNFLVRFMQSHWALLISLVIIALFTFDH